MHLFSSEYIRKFKQGQDQLRGNVFEAAGDNGAGQQEHGESAQHATQEGHAPQRR